MTSLSPAFQKKLSYLQNFSANNVSPKKQYTLPKSNTYHTENRLSDITFDNEKLLKIIQSLDANKVRGYDAISFKMLMLSSPTP